MKWILSAFLVIFASQNVRAWGPEGHMIVAELAEHQLTAKAKAATKELLEGKSLADVSNWPDQIKSQSQWNYTKSWHFVDIPDGENYDSITHDPNGDVITATTQMINTLNNKASTKINQQQALMFLVHFIGDIHQPLHVGRPSDHGGNLIKVMFNGRKTNLHSLWDGGMITKQNLDYEQYAHYLETQNLFNPDDMSPTVPFKQIIIEDMGSRRQIYSFKSNGNSAVVLDNAYMNANINEMNSRLLLGGKRLADVLNSLFQ